MYLQYFGFSEQPFSLTPDPKYLFLSQAHADGLELMQYAVDRHDGFAVVTGDIGTGKTTLCRALLARLDQRTCVSLLLNPFLSEEDLLLCMLRDFGVLSRTFRPLPGTMPTRQDLIDALHQFLVALAAVRGRAVLIIDEAQNLPLKVLEQIRILSNLETDSAKLLQIILLGQRNLAPLLASADLRQLEQRISTWYELRPLVGEEEVAAYIAHRVAIAHPARSVVFSRGAVQLLERCSAGIPRVINLLCDRALIAAYACGAEAVDVERVRAAAQDLQPHLRMPARRSRVAAMRSWLFSGARPSASAAPARC